MAFWFIYQSLKRVWEQPLVHIFCMILQKKCSLFDTLSMVKVSMLYPFSFVRYQTKCIIKFLFRQLIASQNLRFIFHQPLKQWLAGRKRGQDRNSKISMSQERKEFFRRNKKRFSQFLKGFHLVRNKSLIKSSRHKL